MYIRDLKMAKSCGKIMRKWDHVAKFVGVSQQRSICGLRAMWHDRLHDICMQHANKQANKTQTFNITINVNHRLVSKVSFTRVVTLFNLHFEKKKKSITCVFTKKKISQKSSWRYLVLLYFSNTPIYVNKKLPTFRFVEQ